MPRGVKLVVTASVVFLLPLLTGILAAFLAGRFAVGEGERGVWQFGALLAGLLVGVAFARVLINWMGFHAGEGQTQSDSETQATDQMSGSETVARRF